MMERLPQTIYINEKIILTVCPAVKQDAGWIVFIIGAPPPQPIMGAVASFSPPSARIGNPCTHCSDYQEYQGGLGEKSGSLKTANHSHFVFREKLNRPHHFKK